MNTLKILLLTEEDQLYLPQSIDHVLDHCRHNIFHVSCLRNPTTESFTKTLSRFLQAYGPLPLFAYARRMFPVFISRLPFIGSAAKYSVRETVRQRGFPYSYVDDVNSQEFVGWVRSEAPDLIVTISPTQILKAELLAIPRLGCINVHSSFLPMHRGLYPVYWAMAAGDERVGVSIHYLDAGIDTGAVLRQSGFSLQRIRTMHEALHEAKRLGARLMLEAIDSLAEGTAESISIDSEAGSYHSFPDQASYKTFRSNGYRLW